MLISNSERATRKQLTKKFMQRWLLSKRINPFGAEANVVGIFDREPGRKKPVIAAKQK